MANGGGIPGQTCPSLTHSFHADCPGRIGKPVENWFMISQIFIVGIGGFLGSVCRFLLSGFVHRVVPLSEFPVGTLVVNVVGCLLIGILNGLAETRQVMGPDIRLFFMIGLLGGFTTFSTFGYETLALLRDAEVVRAMGNVFLHVLLGLAAVWLGDMLGRVG